MKIQLSHITFTLRLGLAFAYIFIAILCFYSPSALVPYTQPLITGDHLRLSFSILGVLAIALSIWILFGKKTFLSSIISLLIIVVILILGIEKSFVIFATLQLFCLNLALLFSYRLGRTVIPEIITKDEPEAEVKVETTPSVPKHIEATVVDDGPADTIL